MVNYASETNIKGKHEFHRVSEMVWFSEHFRCLSLEESRDENEFIYIAKCKDFHTEH
jgi:hypothetical protein